MKHIALHSLPFVLLIASSVSASAQTSKPSGEPPQPPPPVAEYNAKEWKEYSSPEGRFSVALVGALRQETEAIDTAAGKVALHLFGSDTRTGVYMIAYVDFPQTPEDPAAVRRALDAGRDRMLAEDKNRKLLGEKEITVEGLLAREVLFEDGELFYRNRTFMTHGRLYQVVLAAPFNVAFNTGRPSNDQKDWTDLYQSMGERFFGSFKLLPEPPTASGSVQSKPIYGDPVLHATGDEPEPKARISAGILNGRAVVMIKPVYPPVAKAAGVSGEVNVRIVFDESGKVIWARAISGHEYLRAAAEDAARQTTFTPVMLSGKPMKVSGTLLYKFSL
jgi:TonB family protein